MEQDVRAMLGRLAPTSIGVDQARVPTEHRPLLEKLVEAARLMDQLFLIQVAEENQAWRARIASDPSLSDTLAYFDVMYGPWDRLDLNRPFWGSREKPRGAAFYPTDLDAAELEKWIDQHPEDEEAFKSYFTVIERDGEGLKAVPYSGAYRDVLEPAAGLLEQAAALAGDPRLARYLGSRAQAFRDNRYRTSDMDWMDLGDGDIELVIGPYEVYEDELMGYKASFEAFVTLRDHEESKRLASIRALIPEMEAYLPIPDQYKNPNRGDESPISVVDVLFTAGDARAGIQTLAFVLPNDEVVRQEKGSKKVMLRNVARAKYEKILVPIARRLLSDSQADKISFEAFFNHTLMHEIAHGIGPGKITVTDERGTEVETSVGEELRDRYSVIEEAKADILGMYLNYLLVDRGMMEASLEEEIYASILAGLFRSVRFGAGEAHGKANMIQLNFLSRQAAVTRDSSGRYACVAGKMKPAIESLARELLMIEATGDYEGAGRLIEEYGKMPGELEQALARLGDIPTDIRPIYEIERQMASW